MMQGIIKTLGLSRTTLAKCQSILPGVGATMILLLLTVTCKDSGVTEAAFPLFFLPLISLTSFIMARNRAASLVLNPGGGNALLLSRKIAAASAVECIPFISYFSSWALNWIPFTLGVIMAVAVGGLAGMLIGLTLPGRKIPALSAAVFLQIPSMAGFALFRHPLLLLLPNQAPLEMFDGAFGPLMGAELMVPLLAGSAWIILGLYSVAWIKRGKNSRETCD